MLIPMLLAAIISNFFPNALLIGNPLTALFTSKGTMCIVGIMLVFAGTQAEVSNLLPMLKRGGVLDAVKLLVGTAVGLLIMYIFGKKGILGISSLAWVACITSCNPGVYLALMNSCGDSIDQANFSLLNIIGLPFVPVCILGFAGGNGFDYKSIAATLIPFLVGMLLGCLDKNIRTFAENGNRTMLPFLGFCLGSSINLKLALTSWWQGIILFIVYMAVNWPLLLLIDKKLLKQRGHSSTAICCVAGLALTVPSLICDVDSSYKAYVSSSIAQLSFVVIISAIVTPFLINRITATKNLPDPSKIKGIEET